MKPFFAGKQPGIPHAPNDRPALKTPSDLGGEIAMKHPALNDLRIDFVHYATEGLHTNDRNERYVKVKRDDFCTGIVQLGCEPRRVCQHDNRGLKSTLVHSFDHLDEHRFGAARINRGSNEGNPKLW